MIRSGMTEFEKILHDDAGYVTYLDCQQGLPLYRLQYYSKKLELAISVESRNIRTLFAKFVKRYQAEYRLWKLVYTNAKLEKCNIKKSKSSPELSV